MPATSALLILCRDYIHTHTHTEYIKAKRKRYILKDHCPQIHSFLDANTKYITNFYMYSG